MFFVQFEWKNGWRIFISFNFNPFSNSAFFFILVNGSNLLFAGRRVEPLSDVVDIPPEQLVQMTLQQLSAGRIAYYSTANLLPQWHPSSTNGAQYFFSCYKTILPYYIPAFYALQTAQCWCTCTYTCISLLVLQVNPFVGMWRAILPNLLALIRCIHLVWDTEAKTKLLNHEEAR